MSNEEDSASLCSQLEEAIKCAICWEAPIAPKVLPCQHSFCLRCLHPSYLSDLQRRHTSRDRVQCPLCRQQHPVPKKGLTALPTDHRTNVITEIVLRRRHIQGKKLCSVCQLSHVYTTASTFCLTCGLGLCSKCRVSHQMNSLYHNHFQIDLFMKESTNLTCADHPAENIQFYCGDCARPVCKICTHGLHHSHGLVDFVSMSEGGGDASLELAGSVHDVIEDKEYTVASYRDKISSIQKTVLTDKQKITDQLQEVREQIAELQKRESELERQEGLQTTVEMYLDELDTKMGQSSGRLAQLDQQLRSALHPLEQYQNITVSELCLQALQRDFTRIELPYRDLSLLKEQYKVMVDDYDSDEDVDGAHYFVDIDRDEINSKIKVIWEKDILAYDVQFLPDGSRGLVCTGGSLKWKLHLLDFDGNFAEVPASLARFSECECRLMSCHVTKAMCVTHRTKKDGLILPFSVIFPDGTIKSGSIQTSPDQVSLCGVTLTRNYNVVFAFMDQEYPPERTSLRCYYPGGAFRWCQDTSRGNLNGGSLVTPHYLTTDALNRIVVSDHHGRCVNVFDSSGRHLLEFPRVTLSEEDKADDSVIIPKPSGICVDSKCNIYVAFPVYDVVSLFTANGQFVRHVVATPGQPRGISICEDRFLAVSTHPGGLCVYDLDPDAPDTSLRSCDRTNTVEDTTDTVKNIINEMNETEQISAPPGGGIGAETTNVNDFNTDSKMDLEDEVKPSEKILNLEDEANDNFGAEKNQLEDDTLVNDEQNHKPLIIQKDEEDTHLTISNKEEINSSAETELSTNTEQTGNLHNICSEQMEGVESEIPAETTDDEVLPSIGQTIPGASPSCEQSDC